MNFTERAPKKNGSNRTQRNRFMNKRLGKDNPPKFFFLRVFRSLHWHTIFFVVLFSVVSELTCALSKFIISTFRRFARLLDVDEKFDRLNHDFRIINFIIFIQNPFCFVLLPALTHSVTNTHSAHCVIIYLEYLQPASVCCFSLSSISVAETAIAHSVPLRLIARSQLNY